MSEWLQALPALLLVVALVVLPGLGAAYAVGLRGLVAWGTAPALGVSVLAGAPVVAQVIGLGWSPGLFVAAAAGWLLLALGVGLLLRARWPRCAVREADRPRWPSVAGVGLGVAAVLSAAVPAMGSPHELVDSTDAVAHLNRIRAFLDTANFSSLRAPSYPSGFHDIAATAMQVLPRLDIVEAANLTALTTAAVIWPLGCVALARQCFGRSPVVLLGAGLASATFTSFPFILLGWGVLWPNLLATALLPGVLVPALVATGTLPATAQLTRPVAGAAALLAVPGLTLSHPNGLVSLAMIVALGLMTAAGNRALHSSGRPRARALALLAALVTAVGAGLVVVPRLSRQVADTQSYDFAAAQPVGAALADGLLLSLQVGGPPWGLLLVVLAGGVACALRPERRWIVVTHLACLVLFALAATSRTPFGVLLTGYWYNDKVRLAALATVPALLLAVAGIAVLASGLQRALTAHTRSARPGAGATRVLPSAVVTSALVLFVVATVGLDHAETTGLTARYYRPPQPDRVLLTAAENADLAHLAAHIPEGVVTAGVPANGSSFLYAFHDRPVLFDSLLLNPDPDSALIAMHLKDVLRRGDVCAALRRMNVQYAVTGPVRYWLSLSDRTTGLAALGGTTGFEEVDRAGRYRLYRITACGFGPPRVPER